MTAALCRTVADASRHCPTRPCCAFPLHHALRADQLRLRRDHGPAEGAPVKINQTMPIQGVCQHEDPDDCRRPAVRDGGPCHAHATFESGEVATDTGAKFVLRVPHGCGDEATNTVRIQIPEGVIWRSPHAQAGWD